MTGKFFCVRRLKVFAVVSLTCCAAYAQQARTSITATGEATVSANPDQATVSFSISTTAATASDASNQNAVLTTSVIAALKAAMVASDTLSTISYSLYPNYNNAGNLTGYTATNTIQVVTGDLTSPGKLIDTATQAGATRVQGLSFSLKNIEPLRAQALQQAAAAAQTQVAAIALGLGVKLGSVISASDSSSATPVVAFGVPSAASTPVLAGPVQVTADVRLQVAIAQ
ncbi:MAG TPA: SIMPL domain-containing protein [Bryobacteraceae bacterium]|jgi:hypothetical protein